MALPCLALAAVLAAPAPAAPPAASFASPAELDPAMTAVDRGGDADVPQAR